MTSADIWRKFLPHRLICLALLYVFVAAHFDPHRPLIGNKEFVCVLYRDRTTFNLWLGSDEEVSELLWDRLTGNLLPYT